MRDGWVPSPRTSTSGRPRSMRELYRPAVQDLSEQADRNGGGNMLEESILSVVSSCTPRGSRPGSEYYIDKFQCPTPLLNQFNPEEVIKSSPTSALCFNQHHYEYHEDLHRQRVLVSAHQRQKLNSKIRRAKSTPTPSQFSQYANFPTDSYERPRTSWQGTETDADRLSLVVTNRSKIEDKDCKERINYRLTSRTKPKSTQGTSLMPNGAPLSMINGYTQTLIQQYPKYSQKYCSWLTNGLKVQSVRSRPGSYDFSQSRPPPPLLQYINRPKSVNGRYGVRKSQVGVNFNVVGVQHRS